MTRLALFVLSIIVVAGCAAEPSEAPATVEEAATTSGRIGSHGMVAFGRPSEAYLSHIPMFGPLHDVQLIVRGSFAGAGVPASMADRLYTYLPDRMSLDALRLGNLRELSGTLYLGNFEDGGRPIARAVKFRVAEVVHQHVLDARAPQTGPDDVIAVGDDFTAHLIGGAPSYDAVTTTDGEVLLSCLEGPDFARACAAPAMQRPQEP